MAIQREVPMPDQLSGLIPRIGISHSINHVIQARFKQYQQVGPCYAPLLVGL
jgi:hypothetical protein